MKDVGCPRPITILGVHLHTYKSPGPMGLKSLLGFRRFRVWARELDT